MKVNWNRPLQILLFLTLTCPFLEPCLAEESSPPAAKFNSLNEAMNENSEAQTKALLEEELIEHTVFDLYIGQKFVGSVLTAFTDTWFQIENPKDIIEQAKEHLSGGYADVESLGAGKIRGSRSVEGVGSITYDLNTFRIILDLEPKLLSATSLASLGKVPAPEQTLSLRQDVLVSSSGVVSDEFRSALTHRTVGSIGKFLAQADGTIVEDEDYEFNRASAGGVVGDYSVNMGLLRSQGVNFASSREYLGGSISTEEQLFLDQNLIRGSRIEIFIPSRSRVEYYRGNRLLGVEILDYGLQEVNTATFPQGSYDVDIRIIENNGNEIRERRFFTKSGFLAARNIPIVFLEAGVIRNQLDLFDTPIYQTGIRMRASDILQVQPSVYGTDEDLIGELDLVTLFRENIIRLAGVYSDSGASGVSANISTNFPESNIQLNASAQKTFDVEEQDSLTPLNPSLSNQGIQQLESIDIVNDASSFTASIQKIIGPLRLRLRANRNERTELQPTPIGQIPVDRPTNTARYIYGPEVEWNIFRAGRTDVRLVSAYYSTDTGSEFSTFLNVRYRLDNQFNFLSLARARAKSGQDEAFLSNTVQYNSRNINETGTFAEAMNEVQYLENPDKDTFTTNTLRAEHTGDLVRVDGFMRDRRLASDDVTNIGANLESSFIVSGDKLALSYPVKREAIFIAEVDSKTTKTPFEVLVDGSVYDTIPAGSRSVIGLNPFRSYEVTVRPTRESDLVSFEQDVHKITVFPGNIVAKEWSIEKIIIAIGQLVDEEGLPIEFQRIRGTKEYAITETNGNFQMEISGDEKLSVESDKYSCSFSLDVPPDSEFFAEFGKVVCKKAS